MENKAVLYARVSSKDQEETGYSLDAQEKLLRDYIASPSHKFVESKMYSISESASGKKIRKTFDEMLEYTEKHDIKIIVCEKVDRLTRNLKDVVLINKWLEKDEERQAHFVKEACFVSKGSRSHEKFIWNVKASVAQFYTDNLSEEVKKGQKEKISQGWMPSRAIYGYETAGDKGHKIHVVNTKRAPYIKKAFELYGSGEYSVKRLRDALYKEGMRTEKGKKMSKSRLARLLCDPFYYGKFLWVGKLYNGKQEPLISESLFLRCQEIMKRKDAQKYSKHLYLFKGLVKCVECGGKITWERQKGNVYGHCNHYRNCRQGMWVREDNIEEQLAEAITSLKLKSPRLVDWVRKVLKESHKDEIDYYENAVKQLNEQLKRAESRLDRLYDDRADNRISGEMYERKSKQYEDEKRDALDGLQKHNNASNKYRYLGIQLFELAQNAPEFYEKASIERKRELFSVVFDSLKLDEGQLIYTFSAPVTVLRDAVSITNSSKMAESAKSGVQIFEPLKVAMATARNAYLSDVQPGLRRVRDSNPRVP